MSNKLLAPNGKPSNLNATQYELVRTPAFKKWFGDWEKDPANSSKVVDKNGEPLVVYHTTDSDFSVFNKKKSKEGFFFSANKQRLSAYNKSKILSVFLNLKNPSPNEFEVKGFDGIMDFGNSKNKDVDALYEIIVFEPNQIKLADGTNRLFDANSDDIRFAKGGLLAPNGKPSNLNAEQYKLVRTPEFKNWFGDWENDPANASKVVDENGEPLVVYHGTYVENPFYVFDFEKADLGFHFGTFEQAKNRSETKIFFKGRKSIVNSFFLNIKKLFEISDAGGFEYPQRYIDELVNNNFISEETAKKYGFYNAYYREDNKKIRDYLVKKYNNIGFVYENQYEGIGNSYIVLEPNQIKLADGTNTTFDSGSDDIRFAKGGKVKGDCYLVAGQIAMEIRSKKIDYKGTPYLVHAEVKHSVIDGLRFGHAFIEDDENVYDFSNNREIVMPKQLYYYFGDINPKDKKKYRKYTFKQAREKMVSTGNYGCWDIEVEFNSGGEIVKSYKREVPDYLKMFLDL
jgi:hypothetical protein